MTSGRRAGWMPFAAIVVACAGLQILRLAATGYLVAGDSAWYFSSAHALVTRGSLDLTDEYRHFHESFSPRSGNRKIVEEVLPSPLTQMTSNSFPIGTGLALSPFLALSVAFESLAKRVWPSVQSDGYSRMDQLAAGSASAAYAALGLFLLARAGSGIFGVVPAFLATISLCLGTPIIYYMAIEPLMSHSVCLFFAVLVFLGWMRTRRRPGGELVLGLAAGFLAIVRYQEILWIPVIAADLAWRAVHGDGARDARRIVRFIAGSSAPLGLQLWINWKLRGAPLDTGHGGHFDWFKPRFLQTLFSAHHGLLIYSPLLLLSVAGWTRLKWSDRVPFLALIFAEAWLVGCWSGFPQGASFGNRMLLGCSPVFVWSATAAVRWYCERCQASRRALVHVAIVCGFFVALNGAVATAYCLRWIHDPYVITGNQAGR